MSQSAADADRGWAVLRVVAGVSLVISISHPLQGNDRKLTSDDRCGVHALQACLEAVANPSAAESVEYLLPGENHSLAELKAAATSEGVEVVSLRWTETPQPMRWGEAAAILPVVRPNGRQHFIAAVQVQPDGRTLVVDFPRRPVWTSASDLRNSGGWDGTAVYVCRDRDISHRLRSSFSPQWPAYIAAIIGVAMFVGVMLRSSPPPNYITRTRVMNARRGLTLIEILVVLAVISVLISLTFPAVQRAREAARAVQCRNNLRQMGLAVHQYLELYKHTPPAMEPFFTRTGDSYQQNVSPHVRLLPFLDQSVIYDQFDFTHGAPGSGTNPQFRQTTIPVFTCPSDSVPSGGVSYRMCYGTTPGRHGTPQYEPPNSADFGVAHVKGWPVSSITDGLSQTAFFSERVVGDFDTDDYSSWRDQALSPFSGPDDSRPDGTARACSMVTSSPAQHRSTLGSSWLFAGYRETTYNHVLGPNSPSPDCWTVTGHQAVSARSFHEGGVMLLLGDGAVRFVGQSVDRNTWRALATMNRGEVLGEF